MPSIDQATQLRQQAEHCRGLAERATDEYVIAQLMSLYWRYDELAHELEETTEHD